MKRLAILFVSLGCAASSFAQSSGYGLAPAGQITAGHTLYADAINGPYTTLAAAKAAASSGDTIVVRPGSYSATNLLKDGVNWNFESGAVVTNSSSTTAIFDDWTSGANAPVTCVISGYGVFDGGTVSGSQVGSVLYSRQTTSDITFAFHKATSVSSTLVSRGSSKIYVRGDECTSTGTSGNAAVWWFDGPMHVAIYRIAGAGPAVVYSTSPSSGGVSAGYFWVDYHEIVNTSTTISSTYKALWLQDNEAAQRVWVSGYQIKGPIAVQTSVTGALGYVKAEKIFGQINNASTSGLLYLDAQKVSDDGLGAPLLDQSSGGTSWLNVGQWDDAGLTGINAINVSAGKSYITLGSCERATTGTAVNVSGGEVNLINGRISTQAGSSDLVQSGGTLRANGVSYDPAKTSGTITPGLPQVAPTYLTAANGQLFTVSVSGISGLSTGFTTLFTVPSGKTFVLVNATTIYTTVTGINSQIPTWAIFKDSSVAMTSNTGPTAGNVITNNVSETTPSTNAGGAIAGAGSVVQYDQIQTGATATVLTIKEVITGYYTTLP